MSTVQVHVELPQYSLSFDVEVPALGVVLDVKHAISRTCPGQPRVDGQKLIYKGRLLADAEAIQELWRTANETRVVHLAVSPLAWSNGPPRAPASSIHRSTAPAPAPGPLAFQTNSLPSFPRATHLSADHPTLAWIYYLHDTALSVLSRTPPPTRPIDLECRLRRDVAKRLVEASGRAWPDMLDLPYPSSSGEGVKYEQTTVDGAPYLKLVTPEATPTEAQNHALRVLTYTFPLLSTPIVDFRSVMSGLTPTPTIPPPNVNAPDHLRQQLQQLLGRENNNVQVQVRAIPLRALLTPLILLSLRTLILLYFFSPTRKPFLAILMGAWVLYEAWGAFRGAMVDLNGLDRDLDGGGARGNGGDRANGNRNGNRGAAGGRGPNRTSGDILLNRLAGLNVDRESLALSSPEGLPPASEPGLARKIKVFVSLFVMTLHPAYWNRRRALLREREGRIRTESNAREAAPSDASNQNDDQATQARARMIAQHNRRPVWIREYVDRVIRDEWVDD